MENFRKVDNTIKAKIGADFDPYVLESLEKEAATLPEEPTAPTPDETTKKIDEIEMIKWKTRYNNHLKHQKGTYDYSNF